MDDSARFPRKHSPQTIQKVTLEGGVLTKVSKDDKTGSERVLKTGTTSIKVDYKTVS